MQGYAYILENPIRPTWLERIIAFDRRHRMVLDTIGTAGVLAYGGAIYALTFLINLPQ